MSCRLDDSFLGRALSSCSGWPWNEMKTRGKELICTHFEAYPGTAFSSRSGDRTPAKLVCWATFESLHDTVLETWPPPSWLAGPLIHHLWSLGAREASSSMLPVSSVGSFGKVLFGATERPGACELIMLIHRPHRGSKNGVFLTLSADSPPLEPRTRRGPGRPLLESPWHYPRNRT